MKLLEHPEARAMLAHLDQHPGDAHPALVFADWCEENGFPAHAEMVRLHHHQWGEMFPGGEGVVNMHPMSHFADFFESGNLTQPPTGNHVVSVDVPTSSKSSRMFNATLPTKHAKTLRNALVDEGAFPAGASS